MAPGDTARLYHRLTSYTPEREWTTPVDDPRVRQGFKQIDIPTFPAACKLYPPGLPAVALPREWPAPAAGLRAAARGSARPRRARPRAAPVGGRRAGLRARRRAPLPVPGGRVGRGALP